MRLKFKNIAGGLLIGIVMLSCSKKELPEDYYGTWTSGEVNITVRMEPRAGQYEFIKGKGVVEFTIHSDQTADGKIGQAEFSNAEIDIPFYSSGLSGVDIRIKCGAIGKIFEGDPLESKEVEIWMGEIEDTSDSELRYTENKADFPMASLTLTRK